MTANQYPYTAMQHQWSAFFPVWARAGGPQEFAAIVEGPGRPHRRSRTIRISGPGPASTARGRGIVLGRARQPQNKRYEGKRLSEIAAERGDADPADTCISLMAEEGGTISGIFHTMSEADVRTVMVRCRRWRLRVTAPRSIWRKKASRTREAIRPTRACSDIIPRRTEDYSRSKKLSGMTTSDLHLGAGSRDRADPRAEGYRRPWHVFVLKPGVVKNFEASLEAKSCLHK